MTTLDGNDTTAPTVSGPDSSGGAPMLGMGAPDRCPSCGAEMSPDQRYCVECGNRRGKPRFSLNPAGAAPAAAVIADEPAPSRFSSSATLLVGLAILLLALGVGVLIGNHGGSASLAGKPSYHITVNGGGGSGSAGESGSSGTSGGSGSGSSGAGKSGGGGTSGGSGSGGSKSGGGGSSSGSKTPTASLSGNNGPKTNLKSLHTKKQRKTALKKDLHTKVGLKNGKKLAPETQKLGGKCTNNEVGCTNGKYTGQFFN